MSQLITLCSCTSLEESLNYKKFLAQNGIKSYFDTQNILETNFDKENEEVALEVEHTIENPEYDFTCPKCGSNHIYQYEKPDGIFGVSWLLLGFPVKVPSSKYVCYYCGNEFKN